MILDWHPSLHAFDSPQHIVEYFEANFPQERAAELIQRAKIDFPL